mmetsp:Transcript_15705/g.26481  ORF Transcript_15705/g.26481 Transcript_15705/m.26481 type:complete len:99 (-) Transcript_15705:35-331(-)
MNTEFFNGLKKSVQDVLKKHHKLRNVRQFLKMNAFIKQYRQELKKEEVGGDPSKVGEIKCNDYKFEKSEQLMILKHYPQQLINLNKNIESEILTKYLA